MGKFDFVAIVYSTEDIVVYLQSFTGPDLDRLPPSSGRWSKFSGIFIVSYLLRKEKNLKSCYPLIFNKCIIPITDFNSFLLKILCTVPVTTGECECSVSALRRLKKHMRTSVGQERLTGLALLHVH